MKKIRSFIALLLCGVLYFMLAVGSGSTTTTSGDANGANGQSTYKLNEDIYVTNSHGKYRIKFTGVKEINDRNEFSEKKADRVVLIEYEYENIDMDEDLYVSDMSFKLYDKDNNSMETYPVDYKSPSNISSGRKTTASAAFALNNDNNYIELEFYDNYFNDKADCKVILEW